MSVTTQHPAAYRPVCTSQPQYAAEIDWSNPLTRGLVGCINPASGNAIKVGTTSVSANTIGNCFVSTSNSYLKKTTPLFGNAATILNYGPIGNANESTSLSFGIGTSGAGNQLFTIQASNLGLPLRAIIRTVNAGAISSAESYSVSTGSNTNVSDIWVAVYDGTNQLYLYRNGKHDVDTRLNSGASGAMSSMDVFSVGGIDRGTDAYAPSGYLSALGLAWNRALSPSEIKSLSDNPWQIFKPLNRSYPFDLVRGPAKTQQSYLLGTTPPTKSLVAPAMLRRAVCTSQPQYAAGIDWSNPITRGLVVALSGTSGLNIASGKQLTKIGSVSSVVNNKGIAHQPDYLSAYSGWQYDREITGSVTIFSLVARNASVNDANRSKIAAIATNKTVTNSTFWACNMGNGFGLSADDDKPRFATNAAGIGTIYADGVALSGNNPSSEALSNGRVYAMAFVASSGAVSSGSGAVNFFCEAGQFALNGFSPLTLAFNRALSPSEIKSLSDNPWQIFLAPQPRVWVHA